MSFNFEVVVAGNVGESFRTSEVSRNGETFRVLNFSCAVTDLRRRTVEGKEIWEAGKTIWLQVAYWRKNIDALQKNLQKGMPVRISGTVTGIGTYTSEKTGEILPSVDIRADRIDLPLDSQRVEAVQIAPPRGPNDGNNTATVVSEDQDPF